MSVLILFCHGLAPLIQELCAVCSLAPQRDKSWMLFS